MSPVDSRVPPIWPVVGEKFLNGSERFVESVDLGVDFVAITKQISFIT